MSGCFYDYTAQAYLSGLSKTKTHTQSACPNCGLWTVWTDKVTGDVTRDCATGNPLPTPPTYRATPRQSLNVNQK